MEAGTIAKVVQDFITTTSGEICLQRDEVVQVISQIDRIWCLAQCCNKQGKVPLNNLLALEPPSLAPGQTLFVAIADFNTQEAGDLIFMKGEFLIGDDRIDGNWWNGHIDSMRSGIFPTSHAWQLDTSKLQKHCGGKGIKLLAKVKTSMRAQLAEEMDLTKGETVVITEIIDNDWYRGESSTRSGIFPAAYVEIMEDYSAESREQLQNPNWSTSATYNTSATPEASSYAYDSHDNFNFSNYGLSNKAQEETTFKESRSTEPPITSATAAASNYAFDSHNNFNFSNSINPKAREQMNFNENKASSTDLMTFSPEKEKAAPSSNLNSDWKNAISDLDFAEDDYFRLNMPSLFAKQEISPIPPSTINPTEINIIPYGITLYPFYAQFQNELSFNEGEIVHLLHYIDNDWVKGEIDGKRGIFPTSYINIVIDCDAPRVTESISEAGTSTTSASTLQSGSFAKVLYTFTAQMIEDVSVVENELVQLISKENENWWRVKKHNGMVGLCPENYLTRYTAEGDSSAKHKHLISHRSTSFSGYSSSSVSSTPLASKAQHVVPSSHIEEVVELRNPPYSMVVSSDSKPLERRNSFPRRPSPPRSPPPEPPIEEPAEESSCKAVQANVTVPKKSTPPPVPLKSITLLQEIAKSNTAAERSNFKRLGSDRTPHRPAPPVPAPGQVPVHRAQPRPERHLSSPAGLSFAAEQPSLAEEPNEASSAPCQSEETVRKRRREQRQNVISELALTEMKYIRDLTVTYETFNLHTPQYLEAKGVDPTILFGNILEIIHTSENLLEKIHLSMKGKAEEDQLIAPSFLEMAEELRAVYGRYCMSHEKALALLAKYDSDQEIQKFFQQELEQLRLQIACSDMTSILIKPVQRIMKYPLILNELIKCTEDSHKDKADLLVVVRKMTDVASSINESKRRNDIVLKYLEDGNKTLSTRISRFSFHSVAKMSSRLGMKLSSSLGIGTIIKDPAFLEQEQTFHTLEKTVRQFIKNVESFMSILHDVVMTQLRSAEAIADFYREAKESANVDEFRMTQHTLVAEVFPAFKRTVESKVFKPLAQVLELINGPSRLIQKRNDKLLDYESYLSKAEKSKDLKTQDELNLAKHNYEALNSQLLEELPKLNSLATNIFVDCIAKFVAERKMFSGRVTKQYLELMNLPVMTGCTGDVEDVLEMFKVKHNLVASDLANFSFSSKQFKQDGTLKRNSKLSPNVTARGEPTSAIQQSPSQKAYLLSKYSPENLFIVSEPHISAQVMELSVVENSVVGVIKKQDPMANTERWFVDVGEAQKGFIPRRCLRPLHSPIQQSPSPQSVKCAAAESKLHPRQLSMSPECDNPPRYDEVVSPSPSPEPVELDKSDNQSHLYEEIPENEFYYAEYDFTSLGADFISLKKGQVVNVVHKHDVVGNSEWWYVENRTGETGYVPANYLSKYNT